MTTTVRELSPDQNTYFIDEGGELRPIADLPDEWDFAKNPEYDNPTVKVCGPSVDLGKRARMLAQALSAISGASRRQGMLNSRNIGLVQRNGGSDAIRSKIHSKHQTMRRRLQAGGGFDDPKLIDIEGYDPDEDLVLAAKQFREKYTAYGARALNGIDVTLRDKEIAAQNSEKARRVFRAQLDRQK